MILRCDNPKCVNAYQDTKYGKGKRVHNQSGKEPNVYRCTVCGEKRGEK
jgi:aspartate carbamoyltransferase regulatory subunit